MNFFPPNKSFYHYLRTANMPEIVHNLNLDYTNEDCTYCLFIMTLILLILIKTSLWLIYVYIKIKIYIYNNSVLTLRNNNN